jgi:hypothetical protein
MRMFSLGLMALSAACILFAIPKSASAAPNLLTSIQSETAGVVEQVGRRYYRRNYAYRPYYRRYGYYRPYSYGYYRPYYGSYGYYRRPGFSLRFGY